MRHSVADKYTVETRKAGNRLVVAVSITEGGESRFLAETQTEERRNDLAPGTVISEELVRGQLSETELLDVIGTRFIVDPSFAIQLNGRPVKLFDLQSLLTASINIDPYGQVDIHISDSATADRSSKMKGLTWWVNDRMVGEPSWEGLDGEGSILDGRTSEAKRFSFIIQAPMPTWTLDNKPAWTINHCAGIDLDAGVFAAGGLQVHNIH